MRIFIYIIFCIGLAALQVKASDPVTKIAKANKAKELAAAAFTAGDFEEVIVQYNYLLDSLDMPSEEAQLNRAHAYFQLQDTLNAMEGYRTASMAKNKTIQSTAFSQLGYMAEQRKEYKEGLTYYKEALKADPRNEAARFNYERLKKLLDKQQKDKQEQENKDNKQEEPSEYAKQLKKQAEELIAQRKYSEAFELMQHGLKKDKTVGAFNDFIKRTKDVADIL